MTVICLSAKHVICQLFLEPIHWRLSLDASWGQWLLCKYTKKHGDSYDSFEYPLSLTLSLSLYIIYMDTTMFFYSLSWDFSTVILTYFENISWHHHYPKQHNTLVPTLLLPRFPLETSKIPLAIIRMAQHCVTAQWSHYFSTNM